MFQLLAIGEVMAEIRPSQAGFAVNFAGDTYNTAVYCARMIGADNQVGYLSRLGSEPLSYALVTQAKDEGIDCSYMRHDTDRNIGIYSVTTDDKGERSFHYWRNQSAARLMFETEQNSQLPEAKMIYLSGISLAILSPDARARLRQALMTARKGGALIAFDSNYRPKLWEDQQTAREVMTAFWDMTDIALPSIDDEMELMNDQSEQDVIERFAAKKWHRLAIKRGAKGPAAPFVAPQDLPDFQPAKTVIDTTAAGDSFNGGYFAALLAGKDEPSCLLAGHNLAAKVVGCSGAIMPK